MKMMLFNIGIKFESIEEFEQYSRNTKSIIDKYTNNEDVKIIRMKFSLLELTNVRDQIIDIRKSFDFEIYSVSIIQKT